jgi:hypothetical protein
MAVKNGTSATTLAPKPRTAHCSGKAEDQDRDEQTLHHHRVDRGNRNAVDSWPFMENFLGRGTPTLFWGTSLGATPVQNDFQ